MYKNSKKEAIKLPPLIKKSNEPTKRHDTKKSEWISQQLTIYEVKEPSLEIGGFGFQLFTSKK